MLGVEMHIRVRELPSSGGATVSFEKNAELLSLFKSDFPKARWNSYDSVWTIPGKLAARRAERWSVTASEIVEERRASERAAAAECIPHLEAYGDLVKVAESGGEYCLSVYTAGPHETIATLMRGIGAEYCPMYKEGKPSYWSVPQSVIPLVLGVIGKVAELNVEAARNQAELDGKREAREKELAIQRAALEEIRKKAQAEQDEKFSLRIMMPEKKRQKIGRIFKWTDGIWRVAEGYGNSFRLQEYHADRQGDHLKTWAGYWGCYVYCRKATEDEIARAEAAERDDEEAS